MPKVERPLSPFKQWKLQTEAAAKTPAGIVRRVLHKIGIRFRAERRQPFLPGNPDIVFGRRKTVIFVRDCFWHGHRCKRGQLPQTRSSALLGMKITINKKRNRE